MCVWDRVDKKRVWRSLCALLLLVPTLPLAAQTRTDSVSYDRAGRLYLIHRRDSVGVWRLHRALSLSDYLRYKEQQLLQDDPTPTLPDFSTPTKAPPGLSVTAIGDARLRLEHTTIRDDAPTLPVQMRRRSHLGFSYETALSVRAKYGEHLRMDLQYNTQAALAQDRQGIRFSYTGEEYDLIQNIRAGNLHFVSKNPLVDLGSDLFGLRADFRLGPLTLTTLASRRHDNERKIVIREGRRVQPFEVRSSDYQFARHFFLSEFFARLYDQALSTLPIITSELYIRRVEVWVTDEQQRIPNQQATHLTAHPEWALAADAPPSSERSTSAGRPLQNATRLPDDAYTVHPTLGFISLRVPLSSRQQLAVVYSYSYRGRDYRVGTFVGESDRLEAAQLASDAKLPSDPLWTLMMKNGYDLPYSSVPLKQEDLMLNIYYRTPGSSVDRSTDSTGTPWLERFGLDRTDLSGSSATPDGVLDFLPGTLFLEQGGTLFLPFRTPFATVPDEPYHSLYTTSPYEARQERELDRFVLRGELSGSSSQSISLGATALTPGSVSVRTKGRPLTEGADYTVDYTSGTLTMSSPQEETVEVTIREREMTRTKEKTLMGLEADLQLLPGLSLGGTLLDYRETLPRQRTRLGEEPLHNTLWGVHGAYDYTGRRLTTLLDEYLPGTFTKPVDLHLDIAYAQLKSRYNTPANSAIVLEDFEQGGTQITLVYPHDWTIGSNPYPEDKAATDRRARLAWYSVDPLLVREGAQNQPAALRDDLAARTDPLVRELPVQELFPKRDPGLTSLRYLSTLNLSYYPRERGPYTASPSLLDASGQFIAAEKSWGSIMQPLEVTDFEQEQILYLEGWLLDPYSLDPGLSEGEMLIDLGRTSEEILPGNELYHEGPGVYTESEYGRFPQETAQIYAFDRTGGIPMAQQDRGLDGLTSAEEQEHPLYQALLEQTSNPDIHRDPAGDDYRFYLGAEWDQTNASILERYKYINGTEGNALENTIQGVRSAATWEPDREDLNGNFSLDREEHYYRYRLPLGATLLTEQSNPLVVAERTYTVDRGDGTSTPVRWVKVRIPLSEPHSVYGAPSMRDIRTIRVTLRGFSSTIHLRWALLRFVSSSWQVYGSAIDAGDTRSATLTPERLSLEEDSGRQPIPYVAPPGVERDLVQTPTSLIQADEQALALSFGDLHRDQPVAVFHTPRWDLRHYERLSLYAHLHSEQELRDGEVELFVRLGSDFTQNYYEIRRPLTPTPIADYSGLTTHELQRLVWREENTLVLPLAELPALKQQRDNSAPDPTAPFQQGNLVVRGYPTLGEITSVLIGVRSRSGGILRGEVWVNELSVSGTRDLGGDALLTSGVLTLSDLLHLRMEGGYTSAGFTSLTRDSRHSALEDRRHFALSGLLDLAYLTPPQWHLHAPIRFSTERQSATPFYSPTHSDLLYDRRLDGTDQLTHRRSSTWHLEDWHVGPFGSEKAFYDPSHLHLSYRLHQADIRSPYLPHRRERRMNADLTYDYRPSSANSLHLSSVWDRLFRHSVQPGAEKGTLLSQWRWDRTLQLRYQPISTLSLGLTSSTSALIDEPFASEHLTTEEASFRLFTDDILRSIAKLGETERYRTSTDLTLRLPQLHQRLLAPLTASATWRTSFRWQRGLRTPDIQNGHLANSTRYLDGRVDYRLESLFPKESTVLLKRLFIHGRHDSGSTIPGLSLHAKSAFGIPRLYLYQLGWASDLSTLSNAVRQNWLIPDLPSPQQPSYYSRRDYEGSLSAQLLRGLSLELSLHTRDHRHTTLTREEGKLLRRSGSLRLSSWGLRSFFENPLRRAEYSSVLYDSFARALADGQPAEEAFLTHYTLTGKLRDGLPAYSTLLPSWYLTYDVVKSIPFLARHFTTLQLQHRYSGYLDVPAYEQTSDRLSLRTITQVDEMNPLLGLSLATPWGLTLQEQYTRRRSNTLLLASLRLLEQHDSQLRTSIGYSRSFPALFTTSLPLLGSSEHEVSAHLTHTYIRTYILVRNIRSGTTNATQGLDTHLLQLTLDYKLSRALTLRGFWEENSRRPLVSNYDHPYRITSYGVMVLLRLQP